MEINCQGEFGYELLLVIPYAYYLHLKGNLKRTVSSKFTKELYFFSEDHEEKYSQRKFQRLEKLPNNTLGSTTFDFNSLNFPDYKTQFKNNLVTSVKPFLIVHNKYSLEWGKAPVNFINIDTLEYIFKTYRDNYHIVYSRLGDSTGGIVPDNQHDFTRDNFISKEKELLETYSITKVQDLYEKYKDCASNFNHFQLLLHANCENFISVQGGTSAFVSYFGGKNLIYAVQGSEVEYELYSGFFKKVSNQNIFHAKSYVEMLGFLKGNF